MITIILLIAIFVILYVYVPVLFWALVFAFLVIGFLHILTALSP